MNKLKKTCLCLCIAVIACLPLLNGSLPYGNDTTFHMNRIESLVHALYQRDLYPRIFWYQNYTFGYGSPLFYSIFFLYIPAALRILGIPMMMTYRLFLFLIFFACAWTMITLTEEAVSKDPLTCFLSGLLYVFCTYFFQNTYDRGAIGEALGYIFVPVLIRGMYVLYRKKEYRRWHILTAGLCGSLLSHNISFFLSVLTLIVFCLVHIRIFVKDGKLFLSVLKASLCAFLLTVFFSLPMLEQLMTHLYRVSGYFANGQTMQDQAVLLSDLVKVLPYDYDHLCLSNVGLFLLVLPAFVFFTDSSAEIRKCTVFGYILLIMSTQVFPWRYFGMMSFMQFPQRMLIIAPAFLTLSSAYVIEHQSRHIRYGILTAACILSAMAIYTQYDYFGLFMDYTQPEMIADTGYYYPEDESWYNIMQVSSPDYLLMDTNVHYRYQSRNILHEGEEIADFENNYNAIRFTADSGEYIIPKIFYKGYTARDDSGTLLPMSFDHDTGLLKVTVPEDNKNRVITVSYTGTRLQKITQFISLITLAVLLCTKVYCFFRGLPQ